MQKRNQLLLKNYGPSQIFQQTDRTQQLYAQFKKNMEETKPKYKNSHHNKSLIFEPSRPLQQNRIVRDHGTEFFYRKDGNTNLAIHPIKFIEQGYKEQLRDKTPKQSLVQKERQKSQMRERENENYGSFSQERKYNSLRRQGSSITIQNKEMNYAPANVDWKCPHYGRTKTDVNENVQYDQQLYAKMRRFLENESSLR